VMQFGIMGLFLGPIIAAMAISIFEVYAIKYGDI
jgi:predicted PurR-regulated permease PerM